MGEVDWDGETDWPLLLVLVGRGDAEGGNDGTSDGVVETTEGKPDDWSAATDIAAAAVVGIEVVEVIRGVDIAVGDADGMVDRLVSPKVNGTNDGDGVTLE